MTSTKLFGLFVISIVLIFHLNVTDAGGDNGNRDTVLTGEEKKHEKQEQGYWYPIYYPVHFQEREIP